MSASLVGSEMCIRDSSPNPVAKVSYLAQAQPAAVQSALSAARFGRCLRHLGRHHGGGGIQRSLIPSHTYCHVACWELRST
eukprot:11250798-Alexandrium_andersonii.AAC.1